MTIRQVAVLFAVSAVSGLTRVLASAMDYGRTTSAYTHVGNEWGGNRNYYNNIHKERLERDRRGQFD